LFTVIFRTDDKTALSYASKLVDVTVLAVMLCKRDSAPRSGDIMLCASSLSTAACKAWGVIAGSTLLTLKLLRVPFDVTNVS